MPKNETPDRAAGIAALARRAAFSLLIAVVLGMLFTGAAGISDARIRVPLMALCALLSCGLFLLEGLGCGAKDAAEDRRRRRKAKEEGTPAPEKGARVFRPGKCLAALALVFLPLLAVALWIAATAEPYRYQLQDLPLWLTGSYGSREEIMRPLAAYFAEEPAGARVWVRMALRVVLMPFVGFFSDPVRSAETLDRLSPLFLSLYPLAFLAGYLAGPRREARIAKKERRAKKAAVRHAEKRSLAEELTRGGGEVHYGQRAGREDSHRLI